MSHVRPGQAPAPVTVAAWKQWVTHAPTIDDVVVLAREFTAQLDSELLAKVPDSCRPGRMYDTQDLAAYAYELARYHGEDEQDPQVVETVRSMADFFSQAVARLSQLSAPQPDRRDIAKLFAGANAIVE